MQFNTSMKKKIARSQPDLELCVWVGSALPGAILEYHCGDLALDRTTFGRFGDTPARTALARVARCALDLAERGLVHLVQRRHGPHDSTYYVVAASRRKGAPMRPPGNQRLSSQATESAPMHTLPEAAKTMRAKIRSAVGSMAETA